MINVCDNAEDHREGNHAKPHKHQNIVFFGLSFCVLGCFWGGSVYDRGCLTFLICANLLLNLDLFKVVHQT